ncbi:hypothetical protein CPLU01_15161 [Colletotrichum plurivorum]|uniref:Uncharacterized protein n=1 Tax=Colletotrichum plurivorum TaxID=2175906 RepID=A0A8H6JDT3_9PEZI|nr:hypothetical protein CPLU01_15161 [Colletotrichum plurivorum]
MDHPKPVLTCQVPPSIAWNSLVRRSIDAWDPARKAAMPNVEKFLLHWRELDEFLGTEPSMPMFWFFQRREAFLSQRTMAKWDRARLDDYVLLPAMPGFVTRDECFFVSHFWRSHDDPDPGGEYLRLHQRELAPQSWSHIWVDWSCMPQHPRSGSEETYFQRGLAVMPAIIRNCKFAWFYPPWEPRMWILFEVAESFLTSDCWPAVTEDMVPFTDHVGEMLRDGVRPVLTRHGYRTSFGRDEEHLTSWLELVVLLKRVGLDTECVRQLMDQVTWQSNAEEISMITARRMLKFCRWEGTLVLDRDVHTFKPFPRWEDGKYSAYKPRSTEGSDVTSS